MRHMGTAQRNDPCQQRNVTGSPLLTRAQLGSTPVLSIFGMSLYVAQAKMLATPAEPTTGYEPRPGKLLLLLALLLSACKCALCFGSLCSTAENVCYHIQPLVATGA